MDDVLQQTYQHRTPIEDLRFTPENPNEGDVGEIAGSIRDNGFFGAVTVNRATSKIIAGEHTTKAAKKRGLTHIPVLWVESGKDGEPLTDEEALRLLLVDNRAAALATRAGELLADLLTSLSETGDGLAGTGYDNDALDELLESLKPDDYSASNQEIDPDALLEGACQCPRCGFEFEPPEA